jgi:hypothetical protein
MSICLTVYALLCEGPSVTAPATVSSRPSGCESTARSIHEVSWLDLNHYYNDDESDYSVAILK